MNTLKAGFSRVNVTPMMGIGIRGYFKERLADGVLDELEINTAALQCGDKTVLLMSLDNCGMNAEVSGWIREAVVERTGIDDQAVFISCTHTHTGPFVAKPGSDKFDAEDADALRHDQCKGNLVGKYSDFLRGRFADAAQFAIDDLTDAKLGIGTGSAPNVAFIRRYRMKDGSIRTNPGVNHPEIESPIGEVDERVHVIRIDREGKDTLVLVNFGNHPDVVGGNKISADWPGFLRRTVEKTLDGTKCIFFNGAQGDVNHVNVHPKGGDFNDMFVDFDDVSRGYAHARYIGRVVTGAVLQTYDKVEYMDVDTLKYIRRVIEVPSNMPTAEELVTAREINTLHHSGRDTDLPYKGMMLTTKVAEAERMIRLEHGPESFSMPLTALRIGDIALVGIPGEPFTGIGRGIKEKEGFAMICPVCLTNGGEGYFPMLEAYEEGGYEAQSSPFKAGVAEILIEEAGKLLAEL